MNSTVSPAQKLPLWIFLLADAAFVGTAAYLAHQAPRPLTPSTIFVVAALVLAGALAVIVPLVARYERQKNETLDDRQRALEALARTLTSSADQIGIATAGLNEITELTRKNLKQLGLLPDKLQEKVAELTARLAASEGDMLDALEKELAALRAVESERLGSAADKIAKTAGDLAKLEASTQQQLSAARESLAQLGTASAQHFAELDTATTAAIAKAGAAAADSLTATHARLTRAFDEKLSASLDVIDIKMTLLTSRFGAQVAAAGSALDAKLAALTAAANLPVNAAAPSPSPVEIASNPAEESIRRPRRKAREETPGPAPTQADEVPPPIESPAPQATAESEPPADAAVITEPSPPAAPPPPEEPAAPDDVVTTAPFFYRSPFLAIPAEAVPEPQPAEAAPTAAPDEGAKSARKRTSRKTIAAPDEPVTPPVEETPVAVPEPSQPVATDSAVTTAADEFVQFAPDELPAPPATTEFKLHSPDASVSSVTADGATRLLATAYIGIGNRLFIRGEGPGLSWEKGVPLQFVSIGKWRWETSEATAPIAFKLYKNDTVECSALGGQTVVPGHLIEVTAAF